MIAGPPPTPVGVALREFRITLYRTDVRRGPAKLNLRNLGADVHDIAVLRDGRVLARTRLVRPGDGAVLRITFHRTGRLRLICTVADHAARGMRTTLRVRG